MEGLLDDESGSWIGPAPVPVPHPIAALSHECILPEPHPRSSLFRSIYPHTAPCRFAHSVISREFVPTGPLHSTGPRVNSTRALRGEARAGATAHSQVSGRVSCSPSTNNCSRILDLRFSLCTPCRMASSISGEHSKLMLKLRTVSTKMINRISPSLSHRVRI